MRQAIANNALRKIFANPASPGAYAGPERLYTTAKKLGYRRITRKNVETFLRAQDAYTLHKPVRKRFQHNPIVANDIDHQWEADLVDMTEKARANKGFHFLLTVIDVLSKYAWAIPVYRKDTEHMLPAFKRLFRLAAPRKPKRLHTDRGGEFINEEVEHYLKSKGIHLFSTYSNYKAAIAERFNRTLKDRMYRYFTDNDTDKYLDALPELLKGYNTSKHRAIDMAPADVRPEHVPSIFARLYPSIVKGQHAPKERKPKLPIKTNVRIAKWKTPFEKGYKPGWTQERFRVRKVVNRPKRIIYKLEDLLGEHVKGSFYSEEIQPVAETEFYNVERILRTRRTAKGVKEHFVKWQGYPAKFNSWVKASDVKSLPQSKKK